MKKFFSIFSVIAILFAVPANADITGGFTLHIGNYDTSGTETEKTVSGVTSETNSASKSENFYGASVFAEWNNDAGYAIGVDYVPIDINLGSGSRTDSSTGADDTAEADTGDRSAEAEINDLITIYTHIPIGSYYALIGYHDADVRTKETLVNSTYPDASINGWQYGLGMKRGNMRFEVAYSDFDEIKLTSDNSDTVSADADALAARFSVAF